jgi:hypothetical protein
MGFGVIDDRIEIRHGFDVVVGGHGGIMGKMRMGLSRWIWFFNTSFRALGTLHAINGKYKSYGSLVFTCQNGDQIYAVITADGVLGAGPTEGGADIIGGTGACSGIQGKIDFMPRPAVKASKQGTYQGIGIGKVSWKIP